MEGKGVEVRGSNKDVCLDSVNAGDGENKVDLGDVYNGGGDSDDDLGVDDVSRVNTNNGDDANFGNGDSKFDCGANIGSTDDDGKDDGDADSDIGNDANCGDGGSKVDCSKDIAVNDDNSKSDGGGDNNVDGKGGNDSDGKSNDSADGHKIDGDDDDGCLNTVKNCVKNTEKF